MDLHLPTLFDLVHADALLKAASVVRSQAYAPYSKFLVGAAILTKRDRIYVGCNVEAADYDGTHAEESALSAMVAGGDRSPVMLVVLGGDELMTNPVRTQPCGKCRQKLWEFSSLTGVDLRILVADESGDHRVLMLSQLLPMPFGPADLGIDLEKYRR